jgi:hypothetical protein
MNRMNVETRIEFRAPRRRIDPNEIQIQDKELSSLNAARVAHAKVRPQHPISRDVPAWGGSAKKRRKNRKELELLAYIKRQRAKAAVEAPDVSERRLLRAAKILEARLKFHHSMRPRPRPGRYAPTDTSSAPSPEKETGRFEEFSFSPSLGLLLRHGASRFAHFFDSQNDVVLKDVPVSPEEGVDAANSCLGDVLGTLGNSIATDPTSGIKIMEQGSFAPGVEIELCARMPLLPLDAGKVIAKMAEEFVEFLARHSNVEGPYGSLILTQGDVFLRPDDDIDEQIKSEFHAIFGR